MCSGNFAKLLTKTPGFKAREKISTIDPMSKALGYEGLADPLGEWMHRRAGTEHSLETKRNRLRDQRALAARTKEATPTGGHIRSIAAFKATNGGG